MAWPAVFRWPAMGRPIMPRPIKAIFIVFQSL
jgi:hypothetical protein